MSEMVGDGCNTVNPANYCDISNVGAEKVSLQFIQDIRLWTLDFWIWKIKITITFYLQVHTAPPTPMQEKKENEPDSSSFDVVKATQYGAFDRVQEILDSGFDVNQRDSENVTLLHWAAINNRLEIVKFYIKRGAEVDAVGGELMSTPLHWASRQGHINIIVQLMAAGANTALRDGEGCAALHLAAQFGHTAIVGYLIAKGESVNTVDSNGMTPLMWASYRTASIDPLRLLITLGSSFTATDNLQGNTALHWAIQVSRPE